jgi:hypothetical protein
MIGDIMARLKVPGTCETSHDSDDSWRSLIQPSERTLTNGVLGVRRGSRNQPVSFDDDLLLLTVMEDQRNECV